MNLNAIVFPRPAQEGAVEIEIGAVIRASHDRPAAGIKQVDIRVRGRHARYFCGRAEGSIKSGLEVDPDHFRQFIELALGFLAQFPRVGGDTLAKLIGLIQPVDDGFPLGADFRRVGLGQRLALGFLSLCEIGGILRGLS
jgi:hypothetical protein